MSRVKTYCMKFSKINKGMAKKGKVIGYYLALCCMRADRGWGDPECEANLTYVRLCIEELKEKNMYIKFCQMIFLYLLKWRGCSGVFLCSYCIFHLVFFLIFQMSNQSLK